MDMTRELRIRPPRRKLDSAQAVVEDFQWRFPRDRRDMVVEFCRQADNLETAISRAVRSRDENDKMHNHQSRVRYTSKVEFTERLLFNKYEIKACLSFDRLYDICAQSAVWGIALVTIYDVATRIGAYLKLEPESVYLHAGVRQGWYAYVRYSFDSGEMNETEFENQMKVYRKADRLTTYMLPEAFRNIPADDVEDILCTYRNIWGNQ